MFKRIHPERFGVPEFETERIVRIKEKPVLPKSPYAVAGIYFYDKRVFDYIGELKPSARKELEITDVNNAYIAAGDYATTSSPAGGRTPGNSIACISP